MTTLLLWLAGTLTAYKLCSDLDVWQPGPPVRRDLAALAILVLLIGFLVVALGTGRPVPRIDVHCLNCPPFAEFL